MTEIKNLKIALIGKGWLGAPLFESLNERGAKLIATKSADFDVRKESSLVFNGQDVLIYTVPPLGEGEIEHFFSPLDQERKIIFISSTSVYGQAQGEVNELSPLFPASKTGKTLKESEHYLKARFKNLTILRPGGLIGPDRHPIKHLSGKGLRNGEEYLHLVHRDDVIKSIVQIIASDVWGKTINLINDQRIKKVHYYTDKARQLGLEPPHYSINPDFNEPSASTIISNELSKKLLSIHYINEL